MNIKNPDLSTTDPLIKITSSQVITNDAEKENGNTQAEVNNNNNTRLNNVDSTIGNIGSQTINNTTQINKNTANIATNTQNIENIEAGQLILKEVLLASNITTIGTFSLSESFKNFQFLSIKINRAEFQGDIFLLVNQWGIGSKISGFIWEGLLEAVEIEIIEGAIFNFRTRSNENIHIQSIYGINKLTTTTTKQNEPR